MFEQIEEYIKKPLIERQLHLNLKEDCIEIGGYDSREFRGLLAHFLKTTIPTKKRIALCHACNNHWCSNVHHIYWGTYSENNIDTRASGSYKCPWDILVSRVGLEKAHHIVALRAKKSGLKRRGKKRVKPLLTEVQLNEIEKQKLIILSVNPYTHGWVSRAAKELKISHTQVRRFVIKNMIDIHPTFKCRKKQTF